MFSVRLELLSRDKKKVTVKKPKDTCTARDIMPSYGERSKNKHNWRRIDFRGKLESRERVFKLLLCLICKDSRMNEMRRKKKK